MSKLYFRYGAMGCGKSTELLQVAFNYNERGCQVIIVKPAIDTKANNQVSARIGLIRTADHLAEPKDNLYQLVKTRYKEASCILVDEAQFLTRKQVDQLQKVTVILHIPVICYGLRCDGFQRSWPGSQRLLEIAHNVEELKTICRCGKKATLNARFMNGVVQTKGLKTLIDDGVSETVFCSFCPRCWHEEITKIKKLKVDQH
jgi:thymidine kinase